LLYQRTVAQQKETPMSNSLVIRYTVRPEAAEENQRLVANVFAELAANQPDGLHYMSFRLADGVSFVHVVTVDGEDNPLPRTAAFVEFQRNIGERWVEPAVAAEATIVGSYGFGDI
jgi:hypothetical protein